MNTNDSKFSAEGRFLKWGKEAAEKAQDIVDYWEEHKEEENDD